MQALSQSVRKSSCGKSSGSSHSSRYRRNNIFFFVYLPFCVLFCLCVCGRTSNWHCNYIDGEDRSSMHMCVHARTRMHTCILACRHGLFCQFVQIVFWNPFQNKLKSLPILQLTLVTELKGSTPPIPKTITRHAPERPCTTQSPQDQS
jgi:hypothetical protein